MANFFVKRKLSAGALAAVTYDAEKYSAEVNRVADRMVDAMKAAVGRNSLEILGSIKKKPGTENAPVVVGVIDGPVDPVKGAPTAVFHHFGFTDQGGEFVPGSGFMYAVLPVAHSEGLDQR